MKKKKIGLLTSGIGIVSLVSASLAFVIDSNTKTDFNLTSNINEIERENFYSKEVDNNLIFNKGSTDYQFQEVVDQTSTNDASLYNKRNVLSEHAISVVRNEKYYFNFIKSTENSNAHIIVTPVNASISSEPIKLETQFRHVNGSALWIDEKLVIVGTSANGDFIMDVYSQLEDGQLVLEDRLTENGTNYPHLKNLVDTTQKTIDRPVSPLNINALTSPFRSYQTYVTPIYLSPVTDYSNSEGFEVVAWNDNFANNTLGDRFTTNERPPILISYSQATGISVSPAPQVSLRNPDAVMPIKTPAVGQPGDENYIPAVLYTDDEVNGSTIKAITPVRNEIGQLTYYVHAFKESSISGYPAANNYETFYIEVSTNNNNLRIENFAKEVKILVANGGRSVVGRDAMDFLPYGLVAKGDINNPTNTSNVINIVLVVASNTVTNNWGNILNMTIEDNGSSKIISAPPEQQIDLWQRPNGNIMGDMGIYVDSIHYSNTRDLNEGIHIAIKFIGVTGSETAPSPSYVSKIGTFTWKQPWNPNYWSQNALQSGTILYNYTANPSSATGIGASAAQGNYYYEDLVPTVWDNTYYATGIYEQRKINDEGNRDQIFTVVKNLDTKQNLYNTVIPDNIIVDDSQTLSPSLIGIEKITDIIQGYSQDFPQDYFSLDLASFEFVEEDNRDFLNVKGELINPYQNGIQSPNWEPLAFDVNIQHAPEINELENAISTNWSNARFSYPSRAALQIREAYPRQGVLVQQDGIIGYDSNNLAQVKRAMSPFISNIEVQTDDFLGKMDISYTVTPVIGDSYNQSMSLGLFWGNVYIIPIVIGSALIIGLTIFTIFAIQRKKSKEELSQSLSSGFKLFNVNKKSAPQKPSGPPGMKAPSGPSPLKAPSKATIAPPTSFKKPPGSK